VHGCGTCDRGEWRMRMARRARLAPLRQKVWVDEAGVVAVEGGERDAEAALDRGDGWPPSAGDRLLEDGAWASPPLLLTVSRPKATRLELTRNRAGRDRRCPRPGSSRRPADHLRSTWSGLSRSITRPVVRRISATACAIADCIRTPSTSSLRQPEVPGRREDGAGCGDGGPAHDRGTSSRLFNRLARETKSVI
jgi:hypothetical protein